MTVFEVITAGKDVAVAVAAAVTAGVAWRGLKAWKLELRGRADFDTARAMSKATYALRNAIHAYRSPVIWSNEFPSASGVSSLREMPSASDYQHVYATRWGPVATAHAAFDVQTLEAEALWGEPIRTAAAKVTNCLRSLSAATHAVIDDAAAGGEDFRSDPLFARKMRSIVRGSGDDEQNEFLRLLDAAISQVDGALRKHLAPP